MTLKPADQQETCPTRKICLILMDYLYMWNSIFDPRNKWKMKRNFEAIDPKIQLKEADQFFSWSNYLSHFVV